MIYVASPYSHENPSVCFRRYIAALEYADRLIKAGHPTFSPIAYGYFFEQFCGANGNFESWIGFNDTMILRCDVVHVLMLEGWDRSRGVRHEIEFAHRNGIPVEHIHA